jgi:hypothetical protein
MVYFQTKNPNLGKFWRALEWKILDHLKYFTAIWYNSFFSKKTWSHGLQQSKKFLSRKKSLLTKRRQVFLFDNYNLSDSAKPKKLDWTINSFLNFVDKKEW